MAARCPMGFTAADGVANPHLTNNMPTSTTPTASIPTNPSTNGGTDIAEASAESKADARAEISADDGVKSSGDSADGSIGNAGNKPVESDGKPVESDEKSSLSKYKNLFKVLSSRDRKQLFVDENQPELFEVVVNVSTISQRDIMFIKEGWNKALAFRRSENMKIRCKTRELIALLVHFLPNLS